MRKVLFIAVCMLLLVAGGASADMLFVGGSYNTVPLTSGNEGGGSIVTSYLNGTQLPYLYCIGLTTTIFAGQTYADTYVSTSGQAYDNQFNGTSLGLNAVPSAGQIAFLLDHYALTATTTDQQVALQAAIWHVIDNGVVLAGTSSQMANYNQYLTSVGSDPVSNVLWLSPATGTTFNGDGSVYHYQALVTENTTSSTVPIPAAVWLLGSGLIGLVGIRRRFNK